MEGILGGTLVTRHASFIGSRGPGTTLPYLSRYGTEAQGHATGNEPAGHDRQMHAQGDFQLIDFGGGARLEAFGDRLVDRPHPAALGGRGNTEAWSRADLRFERERGWSGPAPTNAAWPIAVAGVTMELRPTDAGQLGLFPEHLAILPWLRACVEERAADGLRAVLHLFAYTGLATIAMAAAGGAVTHVDAARPTVAWARRNADLAGLGDRPIRWIVDDARSFTEREVRRGRRYAGLVLDPPSYGHGPGARPWRLDEDLVPLLAAAAQVLEPAGFLLLTAHTPGFDQERLVAALGRALARPATAVAHGDLTLATADGRRLELGAFARSPGRAS